MTPLAFVAVASLVCWLVFLMIGLLYTRPAGVEPGPRTLDLGAEPPAVANFLVNGWRLTHDAMTATLIDLAARKAVGFSQPGPDPAQTMIHVPRATPAGLRGYEYQVLAHVRSLAKDGVLPAAALVRGDSPEIQNLWPKFRKQVLADARALGLTRPRWSAPMLMVLNLTAALPAVLAGVVILERHEPVMTAIVCCIFLWGTLGVIATGRQSERDTAAGQVAAAGWLGYRRHILEDEQFRTLPPAAVQIWDRHLAYAAAVGAARTAVRLLPLGASDDWRAWSAYGGRWHQVRISYPSRWRWGKSPSRVGARGLLQGFLGGAGVYYLLKLNRSGYDFDLEPVLPNSHLWLFEAGSALSGLLLLAGVINLGLAIAERISRRERQGEVVRLRRQANGSYQQVAMTDGHSAKTRAYRIFPGSVDDGVLGNLREGSEVSVLAGRYLGYVAGLRFSA